MTDQPIQGSRSTKIQTTLQKIQSGALWLGSMGKEPSEVPVVKMRIDTESPRFQLLSGRVLAATFIAISGFYCFAIGRDRYQSTSEFVIKQPMPPGTSAAMVLGNLQSSSVLSSLEDGRYLQVYLESNDVKKAVFPDKEIYISSYSSGWPDVWSGMSANADAQQQLTFFRNQLDVIPQELSGSIVLSTSAFTADDAYSLNNKLLEQAQRFVNDVNQSISADQQAFAETQVTYAQNRLTAASNALEAFQDRYGQLNPLVEQSAAASFITGLESRLVDLKVEEASLRRQYRDPDAPEVAYVADQVGELERQIMEERQKAVGAGGRDLNKLANQSVRLEGDVAFARDSLASAMRAADNSRMESQRQLKFIVMLSKPQMPQGPDHSWRWKAFLSCIGLLVVIWGVFGFMLTALRRD